MIMLHETGTSPIIWDGFGESANTGLTTNANITQASKLCFATMAALMSAIGSTGYSTEKITNNIQREVIAKFSETSDSNQNAQVFSAHSGLLEKEWGRILGLAVQYTADTDKDNPLINSVIAFIEDNTDSGVSLIHRWIFTTDLGRDSRKLELAVMIVAEIGNLGMPLKSPIYQSARSLISNSLTHPIGSLREAAVVGVDRLCDPSLLGLVEVAERHEREDYIKRDLQKLADTLRSFGA